MSSATLSPLDVIMRQPDGCHLHDHCLTCPLPECYFDKPVASVQGEPTPEQAGEAVKLRGQGLTVREITNRLGISRRTLYRRLGGTG